jgi:hypothetical protein
VLVVVVVVIDFMNPRGRNKNDSTTNGKTKNRNGTAKNEEVGVEKYHIEYRYERLASATNASLQYYVFGVPVGHPVSIA